MRPLRIALASLLLVAGCSTIESGEPKAIDDPATTTGEPTETTETTESTESSAPTEGPNRPKDIDISAIDPCAVLNKVPVRKYGLDGRKPVGGESGLFPGNQDCFSGGIDNNLSLLTVAVADKGAAEFVETANAEVTEFDAQGYPLYVLDNKQATITCFGVLDVHDGQFIWISYGVSSESRQPQTPKAKLCKTVPMIAASMVSALS